MKIPFLHGWLGAILVASSSLAGAATEVLSAGRGSATAEAFVPQFLAQPPTLTAAQVLSQQQFAARQRGAGSLGASKVAFAAPRADTQTRADARPVMADSSDPAFSPEPLAANTFTLFLNNLPNPGGAGYSSSDVSEPSHANSGKNIWYTGNWYAGRSSNSGNTWNFVNPYADFPDFCCDQDVIHDKGRDILLWYRQGVQLGGGNNNFKIGVSSNGGASWSQYTITYTNYGGLPLGWFDYPQLAVSNNYLWITSNYFNANGTFQRMILTKISLDELQAGAGISWTYWSRTTGWTWSPTQGTTDVMYIGDHTNQSLFNICDQPENNSTLNCRDVAVPAWTATGRGSAVCTTPNGLNPCDRLDQRVNVGWLKESEAAPNSHVLGFFWTVAQGNGFNYPYVNAIAVDPTTFTPLAGGAGRPYIFNQSFAFAYAGASPNGRGALGISTWLIGGGYYPLFYVGIDDDYNGVPPGWELGYVTDSTTVFGNRWGDYTRVRSFVPTEGVWSASGHVTKGVGQSPRYVNFGRGRDQASWARWRGR